MKKVRRLLLTYAGALLLGGLFYSCSQESPFTTSGSHDVISFSATIVPINETRVQTDSHGKGTFEADDRLSLYIQSEGNATRRKQTLTCTASGWLPQLSWADLPPGETTFTAFHPTTETEAGEAFTFSVAANQNETAAHTRSDLLWATTTARQGAPVHLAFRHALSRITVTLKSSHTFSPEQLATAEVKLQACPTVSVDTHTGKLSLAPTPAIPLTFHPEGQGSYSLILPPQPIQRAWHEGWISIAVGGRQFTYKAPLRLDNQSDFTALEAGKQVTFRLTIDQEAVEEEWAGKTVWVYGLKDIPTPESWNYADSYGAGVGIIGLKWDARYGWFDCNKRNPYTQRPFGDSEMCWAASSSNLIHWWLEQNKDYVARYPYTGPSAYGNSVDSEIFQLYRNRFANTGNDVAG